MDDSKVIERVLGGESECFSELVMRYQEQIVELVNRHIPRESVMEVAQEAFVSAFKSLGSFRHESPFLHWISAIARKRCHDYWRRAARRKEIPLSSLSNEQLSHLARLEHLSSIEAQEISNPESSRAIIDSLLESLGSTDKMIMSLIYMEDQTIAEVARTLKMTEVAVKVRAHRARKRIRRALEDLMGKRA